MLCLGLFGLIFLSIGVFWRKRSFHWTAFDWELCSMLRFTEISCFTLEKCVFVWFCFRSRCRADQEAADIVVFDLHIHRLWYLMPVPLLLLLIHFAESHNCYLISSPFMNPPLLMGIQSSTELVFAKIYLRWHQDHLKKQEGCI